MLQCVLTRSTAVTQDEKKSIAAHIFIFGFNVHVSSFKYLHLPATDLSCGGKNAILVKFLYCSLNVEEMNTALPAKVKLTFYSFHVLRIYYSQSVLESMNKGLVSFVRY